MSIKCLIKGSQRGDWVYFQERFSISWRWLFQDALENAQIIPFSPAWKDPWSQFLEPLNVKSTAESWRYKEDSSAGDQETDRWTLHNFTDERGKTLLD